MTPKYQNWREYQEVVAEAFRNLGCTAEVNKTVFGARGHHDVDVYVTFEQFGQKCSWIVECKLWSRKKVSKAAVQALYTIVQNTGADRGLIFAEGGFQSGAYTAAQNTNILLQESLEDFRRTAHLELSRTLLIREDSPDPDAPPVYVFPDGFHPRHLLKHGSRLFVSNWGAPQAGNIAIINPEDRAIEGIIELDRYEHSRLADGRTVVEQYLPGNIACAEGKLFVGQVFSDVVLVIDISTKSIVKRIPIPGGGEGAIAASTDGRHVYFASNSVPFLFIIDSATYNYEEVAYPLGGRGSICVLPHPNKSLLYIGIQRGGSYRGIKYRGGNSFLAVYDLDQRRYVGNLYLAEIKGEVSDDSIPVSLTYDEEHSCLFVGMMQSSRGICRIDELGSEIVDEFRFTPNPRNEHFRWVDPLSQAIYRDKLLSVNRNNLELVTLDKETGHVECAVYLGDAPNGPHSVAVFGDLAVISYPGREGLIFHDLVSER